MAEEIIKAKRIGRPPTKFFTEEERKQGARDRTRAWALANPERIKANQEKNKEDKSEYNKNYAIENRDDWIIQCQMKSKRLSRAL
jgi:hypothetical protein